MLGKCSWPPANTEGWNTVGGSAVLLVNHGSSRGDNKHGAAASIPGESCLLFAPCQFGERTVQLEIRQRGGGTQSD